MVDIVLPCLFCYCCCFVAICEYIVILLCICGLHGNVEGWLTNIEQHEGHMREYEETCWEYYGQWGAYQAFHGIFARTSTASRHWLLDATLGVSHHLGMFRDFHRFPLVLESFSRIHLSPLPPHHAFSSPPHCIWPCRIAVIHWFYKVSRTMCFFQNRLLRATQECCFQLVSNRFSRVGMQNLLIQLLDTCQKS